MPTKLKLRTGDVTTKQRQFCEFEVSLNDRGNFTVSLSGASATLDIPDWPRLVQQVTAGELVKRHFPQSIDGPLGSISNVVSGIKSTPTFQLFLAGIDIAERIDLIGDTSFVNIERRFNLLENWTPSVTGAGGLFFLPASLSMAYPEKIIEELIINNKLCSASLNETLKLYVPYATPNSFIVEASKEALKCWDRIRSIYYANRSARAV